MASHTTPDPVNRWATEHYGFEDEPNPPPPAPSAAAPRPRAPMRSSHPRRRSAWLAGGVLSVLLGAVGVGGITMAANAADPGPGDRDTGDVGGFDGGRR
jgi:hypothetical protein